MFSTIWIQWIPLRLKMASSRIESILESSTNPGRCTWSQNRRWTMTWPMMEPLYQYAFSDDRISRYASSILQERCRRPHQSLWWFLARHETFLFPGVGEEEKKSKGPQLCWTLEEGKRVNHLVRPRRMPIILMLVLLSYAPPRPFSERWV